MIQDMIYHIILLLLNMYDTDNSMIQDILISVIIYIYVPCVPCVRMRSWLFIFGILNI